LQGGACPRPLFVILSKGGQRFDKPANFTYIYIFAYIANKPRRLITGRLDGKVAIVTGASGAIGESAVKLFAAEDAKVVCTTGSP
jgi:NADPH-dependent curcumin reductase CurA